MVQFECVNECTCNPMRDLLGKSVKTNKDGSESNGTSANAVEEFKQSARFYRRRSAITEVGTLF